MSDSSAAAVQQSIRPAHVPERLVRNVDVFNDPRMSEDPFGTILSLHDGEPIVWNGADARFGTGAWVLSRAEDIRSVLNDPRFAVGWAGNQSLVGEDWPLLPIGVDGDQHRIFRNLMNPWFSPPQMSKLADAIRKRAAGFITDLKDRGGCEFISDFSRPYPVSIFMELMGLPPELEQQLITWEHDMMHQTNVELRVAAARGVLSMLWELAEIRRKDPKDDLTSKVVTAEIDGRPLEYKEVMGVLFAMFLAGLDTVAAVLSLHVAHLARDTALQARLRANPELISKAVEEMLRRYAPANTRRQAREDVEFHGVTIKAGEWIQMSYILANMDPDEFDNPAEVDIDREKNRHLTFAFGPHFCIGSHLARMEIQTALAEMLAILPPFRIADEADTQIHGGLVIGYDRLPLTWS